MVLETAVCLQLCKNHGFRANIIKNTLMRLDLSQSYSDSHCKNKIYGALTLERMRTRLGRVKPLTLSGVVVL